MGGTILRHSDWQWHVLALCRSGDPDREPRFHAAARELGVREYISDLDDSPELAPLSEDLIEIKDRVRALPVREFDLIFTHGPGGEYSHPRHAQTHQAVRDLIAQGGLTGALVVFAYQDFGGAARPLPIGGARIVINLTPDEFRRKQRIVRGIYNLGPGSFELESAGPVEAFNADDTAQTRVIRNTEPLVIPNAVRNLLSCECREKQIPRRAPSE